VESTLINQQSVGDLFQIDKPKDKLRPGFEVKLSVIG